MITIRRVVGESMEPSLYQGSIVIARHIPPKKGDIVIAKVQGREVIKRIGTTSPARFYLTGDNATHSSDSRQYGSVPASDIIGVVWVTLNNHKK